MNEDLLNIPVDTGEAPDAPPTWEDVRDRMTRENWHPDLKKHVTRLLGENGISPPEPDIEVVGPAEPLAAEVVPPMPEGIRTTPGERQQAFVFGLKHMYSIASDARFHDLCEKVDIDPYDDTDPRYWEMFSTFTQGRVTALHERMGDNLGLRSLELMAAAPAYLHAERELQSGSFANEAEKIKYLNIISGFHGMISDVAERFPDIKAPELTQALLGSVNKSLEGREDEEGIALLRFANRDIPARIRGIQHEVAFGDILRHSGLRYRKATALEDIQGFDYIIDEGESTQMKLDVKAGLSELGKHVDTDIAASALNSKGAHVIYSLILDHELHEGFHLSEALAAKKAEALRGYLGGGSERVAYSLAT